MHFTDIATEQTTAITDVVIALQAIAIRYSLAHVPAVRPFWTNIWASIFTLTFCASVLGAAAHGIQMTDATNRVLWLPLYLMLGIVVALFFIAAVAHTWNDNFAQRFQRTGIGVGVVFFVITQIWSDSFILFVIYEGITMLIVFILYFSCLWQSIPRRGSGVLAMGVFIGILAAVIDAQKELKFTCIWEFDNHGVFHLVEILSLYLVWIGVHRSFIHS